LKFCSHVLNIQQNLSVASIDKLNYKSTGVEMDAFYHVSHVSTQSRRNEGALVGLAPPNKAPSTPKLKYETLQISVFFVKFRM